MLEGCKDNQGKEVFCFMAAPTVKSCCSLLVCRYVFWMG